jgi:hypothetical protein
MFKKKSNNIQFISIINGIENIEECLPKPAKNFIPQWFKDIPSVADTSVKVCPSFPDYFSQGYVLPMWCDVKLKNDGESWSWQTPDAVFSWSSHDNNQFLDYTKPNFNGIDANFVFKAECPWRVITPPGWSVLQLPLFYHFNKEWSVMPGIIDTDIHHEINQQVLYHCNNKEIIIKRGDPFVLYIPFKRSNKLKHEIRYKNEEDNKKFNSNLFDIVTKFRPNGIYRKKQRERDKKIK